MHLPLFAQQRLWFLDQLFPGNSNYNIYSAFHIQGHLDISALEFSLRTVVARHEALRTYFVVQDGLPRQLISSSMPFSIKQLYLDNKPNSDQDAVQAAKIEVQRLFNLEYGPLFRILLIRLSDFQHILVITIHHSVSDGWSMDILNRELAECYAARIANHPANLPTLPIQYADYAVWQRTYLQGDVLDKQITYWRQQLPGAPTVLELPTDYPHPSYSNLSRSVGKFFSLT